MSLALLVLALCAAPTSATAEPEGHTTRGEIVSPAEPTSTGVPVATVPAAVVAVGLAALSGEVLPGGAIPLTTVLATSAHGEMATVLVQNPPPAGPTIEYYALDALGSVRVVFDAAGQVLARADYEPFGAHTSSTQGPLPRERFTGQERDNELGLDYFGARFYHASHGRFLAVDPLYVGAMGDPQRWNRYAYALNSPLVFADPDGRTAQCFEIPSGSSARGPTSTRIQCFDVVDVRPQPAPTLGNHPGTPGQGTAPPHPTGCTVGPCGGNHAGGPPSINPYTDILGQAAPATGAMAAGAAAGAIASTSLTVLAGLATIVEAAQVSVVAAGVSARTASYFYSSPNAQQRLEHTFRSAHRLFTLGHPLDTIQTVSRSVAEMQLRGQLELSAGGRIFSTTVTAHGTPVHVTGVVDRGRATITNMWVLTGKR